jgi:hypothetical protein
VPGHNPRGGYGCPLPSGPGEPQCPPWNGR